MPVHLRLDGLAALREALLKLPVTLRDDARPVVTDAADAAESAAAAAYAAHRHTGTLARGLRQTVQSSAGGVRARLENKARHAVLFERGTELRHTALGWNRGRMPAGNVFIPAVIRARRRMIDGLIAVVEKQGLKVRGG